MSVVKKLSIKKAAAHSLAEEGIVLETISQDTCADFKWVLSKAYHDVLKPAFDEIGASLEAENRFLTLTDVNKCNPDAQFHMVIAKYGEKIIAATSFFTYKNTNTVFWLYEAVDKGWRKNHIATHMQQHMNAYLQRFFDEKPYYVFGELSSPDRTKIFEKMESLKMQEIGVDYQDSLGNPQWSLFVKVAGPGAHSLHITKHELYDLLKNNRELALLRRFTPEEEAQDPVMQFYRNAFANIEGDEVPIHRTPFRYKNKVHRDSDKQSRSCSDSL